MQRRTQCFHARRVLGGTVKVPDLRLVKRAQRTLLRVEIIDVLILAVDQPDRSMMRGLEDTVFLKVLHESKTLLRRLPEQE